jgi:hypothetical protein
MAVLIIYVLLVILSETIIIMVGLAADSVVPAGWNVILAMAMFFGAIGAMWPIAVFITERWFSRKEKSAAGMQAWR